MLWVNESWDVLQWESEICRGNFYRERKAEWEELGLLGKQGCRGAWLLLTASGLGAQLLLCCTNLLPMAGSEQRAKSSVSEETSNKTWSTLWHCKGVKSIWLKSWSSNHKTTAIREASNPASTDLRLCGRRIFKMSPGKSGSFSAEDYLVTNKQISERYSNKDREIQPCREYWVQGGNTELSI